MTTPMNSPFIIGIQGVELSPYFKAQGQRSDIQFYDFTLQTPSSVDTYQYENEENQQELSSESQQNIQLQQKQQTNEKVPKNSPQLSVHNKKYQNYQEIQRSRYNLLYFNKKLSQLKQIHVSESQLLSFVLEFVIKQNAINQHVNQKNIQELITIAQNNLRPVGNISWLQRKFKVEKYIEKKKKRVWKKKINYDCRKKVADNRLRVKGKFVTKEQACHVLGVEKRSENQLFKLLMESKCASKSTASL